MCLPWRVIHTLIGSLCDRPAGYPVLSSATNDTVGSAPKGLADSISCVAGCGRCNMSVTLGNSNIGVAEDLLHDADMDALLDEERAGGVAAVVDSGVADAGLAEECFPLLPLLPVAPRVDRPAVRLGEE